MSEVRQVRDDLSGVVRDVDERRHEVLVSFPHERVDTYKTTFAPECFRASFAAEQPRVMCWQHRIDDPIGRVVSRQVTSTANEIRARFSDLDVVPHARRAFTQLKEGTLRDFSFGFQRLADRPHPERRGVTQITRALMHEISPVTVGSIPGAGMVALRSPGWADPVCWPAQVALEAGEAGVVRALAGWSLDRAAAVVGVSPGELRAWEDGCPVPSTPAGGFYRLLLGQWAERAAWTSKRVA